MLYLSSLVKLARAPHEHVKRGADSGVPRDLNNGHADLFLFDSRLHILITLIFGLSHSVYTYFCGYVDKVTWDGFDVYWQKMPSARDEPFGADVVAMSFHFVFNIFKNAFRWFYKISSTDKISLTA